MIRFPFLPAILAATILTSPLRGQQSVNIPLTEPYSQIAWAGSGKFVALHIPTQNKVDVFDLAAGKLALTVEEAAEGDLIAAGKNDLVVISPSKMMLRRFDLATGKREKLASLAGNDPPRQAHLGCASEGPLLLVGAKDSKWIALESLRPLEIQGSIPPGEGSYGLSVSISADGQTLGTIPIGYGPVAYDIFHLQGNSSAKVSFGGTSNAIRWAQPSGNGDLIATPEGVVNRLGRTLPVEWLKDTALIPCGDPRYLIAARVDQKDAAGNLLGEITICSTADCRPLVRESGFQELAPRKINSWHDIAGALRLGGQWRVQYLLGENLLVTLPAGNDRIVLHKFDLREKLKQGEQEFLYVDSLPPLAATMGETMNYEISVQSRRKKLRIALEDGPAGAKISGKNTLVWKAPGDFDSNWARFLISISSGEREIFHSFEVKVSPGEK